MSKHAVVGLSTSLRVEGELCGVRVSAVCPGLIDTPIVDAGKAVGVDKELLLASLAEARIRFYPPDKCARDILRGVRANRAIIVVTATGKLMTGFYRLMPALSRTLSRLFARHTLAKQDVARRAGE
ncbi:MAG: SDR family NAD(P)-dependent oxidoreductase, partial [Myxococcota bacterium]|nr:SDR family NAD(P)-dependent oxidoreductase [Myxococcota bacterium]